MDKMQNPFLTAIAVETTLRTPLPDVVWCEQPTSTRMRADDCKVDHATPKTRVLRQMRTDD